MHNKIIGSAFFQQCISMAGYAAIVLSAVSGLIFSVKTANASDTAIVIENAIEGQTYVETVKISNPREQENCIMISSSGNILQWIEFYDNPNSIAPIAFMTIPAKSTGIITAKITVPENIPKGDYSGNITTAIVSEDITGIVFPQTTQEVKVRVGNKKIIAFDAFIAPKNDIINEKDILAIKVIYKNRSNIKISPSLEVRIKKDEQTIYHAIFPYPENCPKIAPNLTFEIPAIEISTQDFKPEEYEVFLEASEGDKDKYSFSKEFSFKIIENQNKKYSDKISDLVSIEDIFSIHGNPPPLAISIPAAIGAYAIFIALGRLLPKLKAKFKHTLFRFKYRNRR